MQNETLASGAKNQWPRMNLAGSFLHPNIAANMQRYMPVMKNTLNIKTNVPVKGIIEGLGSGGP